VVAITWLGHATTLIEVDGVRLLTDPVLRRRIGPLTRIAPSARVEALGRVDCVLLSHLHADHTDLRSLRDIGPSVPVLAPHRAAGWLSRHGLSAARELRAGEETVVNGVRVTAAEADHDGRRTPLGPSADAIGFLARGSSSVYFAGDTDYLPAMAELTGSVDVALLPVWGWGPTLGPGHLDPPRAAAVAALIAPRVAIPIHWGTFALGWPARRPSDPERPAREFATLAAEQAPSVEVRVLAPGERTEVNARPEPRARPDRAPEGGSDPP
jgi:L-ascorbate metabolism protein UlaG (beta-lactamase superfamily)